MSLEASRADEAGADEKEWHQRYKLSEAWRFDMGPWTQCTWTASESRSERWSYRLLAEKCQSKGGDVSHVATAAPLPKSKSLPGPIANLRMMHACRTQILYFQPSPPYTQERTPFRLCKAVWLDSFPFRVSPIRWCQASHEPLPLWNSTVALRYIDTCLNYLKTVLRSRTASIITELCTRNKTKKKDRLEVGAESFASHGLCTLAITCEELNSDDTEATFELLGIFDPPGRRRCSCSRHHDKRMSSISSTGSLWTNNLPGPRDPIRLKSDFVLNSTHLPKLLSYIVISDHPTLPYINLPEVSTLYAN